MDITFDSVVCFHKACVSDTAIFTVIAQYFHYDQDFASQIHCRHVKSNKCKLFGHTRQLSSMILFLPTANNKNIVALVQRIKGFDFM